MTLMTHAVVGASVAALIPQHPVLAFCGAFASHFLIDAIPHADYKIASASVDPNIDAPMRFDTALLRDMVVIGSDALLGLAISLLLFVPAAPFWLIFVCASAGVLPDPLQFVYSPFPHEPLLSLHRFH